MSYADIASGTPGTSGVKNVKQCCMTDYQSGSEELLMQPCNAWDDVDLGGGANVVRGQI